MTVQDDSVDAERAGGEELARLTAEGPAELLDRSIGDYGRLLREAPGELRWEHVDALDYALRHTVVRLLVRAAERDELADAYDALRWLVPVEREDEMAEWVPRWRAFADLLDARLSSLAAREPERVLELLHAREIIGLVAREPGLTQIEVGARLGLKPPNLSRILGVLEAHEFIERRTAGREKRVHLGRLGGELADGRESEATAEADREVERMASYLFQPHAA